MKIPAIIQARMSSQRLPGKVLQIVEGKPMLQYLIERLAKCVHVNSILVATSKDSSDAPIIDFCKERRITYYLGDLHNVASRFLEIAARYHLKTFVRINGDSPLLDSRLVDQAIEFFSKDTFDLVTNVLERTYPTGQSVEVIASDAFRKAYSHAQAPEDFEHVTKTFYKKPESFKIFNFKCNGSYQDVKLAVDTPEDMKMFQEIIKHLTKPHWDYTLEEIVPIYRSILKDRL